MVGLAYRLALYDGPAVMACKRSAQGLRCDVVAAGSPRSLHVVSKTSALRYFTMDTDKHACVSIAAIQEETIVNTAHNPAVKTAMNVTSARRPVPLTNITLYFQGRPNVVFLDRFAGRVPRHVRIAR
jgi:hypothetical protein